MQLKEGWGRDWGVTFWQALQNLDSAPLLAPPLLSWWLPTFRMRSFMFTKRGCHKLFPLEKKKLPSLQAVFTCSNFFHPADFHLEDFHWVHFLLSTSLFCWFILSTFFPHCFLLSLSLLDIIRPICILWLKSSGIWCTLLLNNDIWTQNCPRQKLYTSA